MRKNLTKKGWKVECRGFDQAGAGEGVGELRGVRWKEAADGKCSAQWQGIWSLFHAMETLDRMRTVPKQI